VSIFREGLSEGILHRTLKEFTDITWQVLGERFKIGFKILKKLKQSRNNPGVARRVPRGLGSQISMIFGTLRW
jgi:hypothetical protein